ncbi:hypothetical protein SO802_021270 [Lithocarpus litseifolius]|uniref:Uncharacterized protein n=1 Tax=Lithocarpus litseifolius TaxID=425828 RepID=A0AAW2CHB6_9ROSI
MDINKDKYKPAAKKWMTTLMPNYSKMTLFWAKDKAKGDHAETAKEKCARSWDWRLVADQTTAWIGRLSGGELRVQAVLWVRAVGGQAYLP